ncbi:MAG: GNAT family N-acetyltransferase [Pseudomonadota bacterium]
MSIKPASPSDLPGIGIVVQETGLFPPDLLAEMIAPYIAVPEGDERWLVALDDSQAVAGFAYFRAEPMTEGTWNLLAIGVRNQAKGQGFGSKLISAVEQALAQERLLIIDTSSLDEFNDTQAFYVSHGYHREAVIENYWADGDDKVTFAKALQG